MKCELCGNTENLRGCIVEGKDALVCDKHGASTRAEYDEIRGKFRARIHKVKDGYRLSRIHQVGNGSWISSIGGRQNFKKLESALKQAKEYLV